MGWWSECIMGGDMPYDIADMIEDKIKSECDCLHMPDCWDDATKKIISLKFKEYGGPKKVADEIKNDYSKDNHCFVDQVVSLLALSSGSAICEDFRKQAIAACDLSQVEIQGWCDEESRKKVLDSLRELIQSYDNTNPSTMKQTGLMERIFGLNEDTDD